MRLRVANGLPADIAALPATDLADALGGPTLFDMRKDGAPPLLLSVLLHGNEVSGWDAVRGMRRELLGASVQLFVGNVAAAKVGRRCVPGGVDFNRVWEGGDSPEAALAEELAGLVEEAKPWLAVDIHNNTGCNPPYSVVFDADPETLGAARAFSAQALLATQPKGVQTKRLSRFCTALTVEVGQSKDPASRCRAEGFLRRLLAEQSVPVCDPTTLRLFETAARVTLAGDATPIPQTQAYNFRTAARGVALAEGGALAAWTADGSRVDEDYLAVDGGVTRLKRPSVLGMYTDDVEAARLDCLCYLLEPRAIHG